MSAGQLLTTGGVLSSAPTVAAAAGEVVPQASLMTIEYEPGFKPAMVKGLPVAEVKAPPLREYWKGPTPPVAVTVRLPSAAPAQLAGDGVREAIVSGATSVKKTSSMEKSLPLAQSADPPAG